MGEAQQNNINQQFWSMLQACKWTGFCDPPSNESWAHLGLSIAANAVEISFFGISDLGRGPTWSWRLRQPILLKGKEKKFNVYGSKLAPFSDGQVQHSTTWVPPTKSRETQRQCFVHISVDPLVPPICERWALPSHVNPQTEVTTSSWCRGWIETEGLPASLTPPPKCITLHGFTMLYCFRCLNHISRNSQLQLLHHLTPSRLTNRT